MTQDNPFSRMDCNLGVGNDYGWSKDDATENLLRSAYSSNPKCYVCGNTPHVRIVAKDPKYTTATIQNGLYCCNHCIRSVPLDTKIYGIKKL